VSPAVAVACAIAMSSGPDAPAAVDPREPPAPVAVTEPEPAAEPTAPSRLTPTIRVDRRSVKTSRVRVGIGLGPGAPGNTEELAVLGQLESSLAQSRDPIAIVVRVDDGSATPRALCRQQALDLVVQVDHVAARPEPVLAVWDCAVSGSLALRGSAAAAEPELLPTLWKEHVARAGEGVRARNRWRPLKPTVKGAIIATVVVVAIGTAVGILVANALRDERVVLTVRP
jgi:hypothetical protein